MPVGKFTPFDPLDPDTYEGPRIFARPTAFDCECPHCGRLFRIGPYQKDNACFHRGSSELTCLKSRNEGCGRVFLVGLIFWPIQHSTKHGRPVDQRPTTAQLQALRAKAAGVLGNIKKRRTEPLNQVEPLIEIPYARTEDHEND